MKIIKSIREQLKKRPTLKLISINSGWLVADKLLRLFIGLFISGWVARYLGPEKYGKLAYVIAFLAVFQALSLLGLDSFVVRDISKSPTEANQVLGTSLWLRFFASVFSFLIACSTIYFIYPENIELHLLVFLVGFGIIFQTADVVDLWFQSQSQSRRTVIAKAISYIVAAAVKVVLIVTSSPLWLFAAAMGGETALSAIALYISYKRYPALTKWEWNAEIAKKMLIQSIPLLLSSISIIIYMKGSQLIINELVDSAAVGLYATAQILSELWYFLPLTIVTSVAPIIARKKRESELAYTEAFNNIFVLMWIISTVISFVIAISSELIVTIIFGEAYRSAGAILSIHIFSLIPVCIGVAQGLWLINENRSNIFLYQAIAGALSSFGLNLLFISKYGAIGGAVATVMAQFIQAFAVNAIFAPDLFEIQVKSLFSIKRKLLKLFFNNQDY